ncbi:MAG: hypothetical protein HY788_11280 [Deltaproteobacteria bacterium]|nr:hypothetical protein [Deltaproteobacteria bacterium]
MIEERQKSAGWGAGVTPRLSRELKNELPELKGFSERNIGLMIALACAYPDPESILQPPDAKLPASNIDSPHYLNFGNIVWPIFDRIKASMLHSRTLSALRDALLPKLLSGGLRLPDAERIAARCL